MNDCDTSQWSQPCYTVVFTCLGIEELNAGKTKLRVYPNPARGFVVFELPAAIDNNPVQKNTVIPLLGVIPTAGRNPPTNTAPAGKPHGTSTGQNSKGVSRLKGGGQAHVSAQSEAQGFDRTSPDVTTIVILDVYGQKVAELQGNGTRTTWQTGSVETGVYFYRIEVDGEVLGGKVVVQK
jgi:hypothetical protein